jgi:hypothetical protein
MFSFGIGSWAAAMLVRNRFGADGLVLLNCDTRQEDEDTYTWGRSAAAVVGGELVTIADGRDLWQLFFDRRYISNTRVAHCSQILKQELARDWVKANCDPSDTTLYVGVHADESHRLPAIRANWLPWAVDAPLTWRPLIGYSALHEWAESEGLWKQKLYQLGFAHANCGGFCVKGGQAHFKLLLETMPERYAYHERREQELRTFIGKDVAILRDRSGGSVRPLTLREFRERLQASGGCDEADFGGCGCFTDYE